jgi:hypothetical protein
MSDRHIVIKILTFMGGLAIAAMRHFSQGPLQSPIQNVKKGFFGGILGAFWIFLYRWSQRSFKTFWQILPNFINNLSTISVTVHIYQYMIGSQLLVFDEWSLNVCAGRGLEWYLFHGGCWRWQKVLRSRIWTGISETSPPLNKYNAVFDSFCASFYIIL